MEFITTNDDQYQKAHYMFDYVADGTGYIISWINDYFLKVLEDLKFRHDRPIRVLSLGCGRGMITNL